MSVNSKMTAIADAIRSKTGGTDVLTLDEMATAISGIEVSREPELQEKTVAPSTNSQTVTPDSGYDGLSKVTVNAMPTATQATPSITVNSSGLITASATQTAGYVSAGTKSGTKQLTTQAAKTITPSKSSQTAVASGRYTTGAVTVAAIPSTYVQPSGTLKVTTNGTHDVKNYESVNVSVAGGGGSGESGGTCTFTINASRSSSRDYIAAFSTINYLNDQNMPTAHTINSTSQASVSATITVRKNSLVVVTLVGAAINNVAGNAIRCTGDCVVASSGYSGVALFSDSVPFLVNDTSSASIIAL